MAINIMDEISLVLSKAFPDVRIYTDDQEAGFRRPAFAVYIPNLYSNKQLFKRTMRNYLVIIKYYPPKAKAGDSFGDMGRSQSYQMLEDWEEFMCDDPFDFLVWNRRATITNDNTVNIKFNAKFRIVQRPDDDDDKFAYMKYLRKDVRIRYGREQK